MELDSVGLERQQSPPGSQKAISELLKSVPRGAHRQTLTVTASGGRAAIGGVLVCKFVCANQRVECVLEFE